MTASEYNLNDPLFLASREMDGDLTSAELAQLEQAMSESPQLRAEVAKLRTASRLATEWGKSEPTIDWNSFSESVATFALTADESVEVDKIDNLVAGWAQSTPEIDLDSFANDVMAQLSTKKQSSPLRLVLRLGMPMAAAAAIALAVMNDAWMPQGRHDSTSPVIVVDVGPSVLTREKPTAASDRAIVSVSFSRETTVESVSVSKISFISFSSTPIARNVEEYQPS